MTKLVLLAPVAVAACNFRVLRFNYHSVCERVLLLVNGYCNYFCHCFKEISTCRRLCLYQSMEGVYGGVCEYKVVCEDYPKDLRPFPPCAHTTWGPGDSASKFDMVPQQTGAILHTHDGLAEVRFRMVTKWVQSLCVAIFRCSVGLTRHLFVRRLDL